MNCTLIQCNHSMRDSAQFDRLKESRDNEVSQRLNYGVIQAGSSVQSHGERWDLVLPQLHIMLVTTIMAGMTMPYTESVGNELSTARTFAYPPVPFVDVPSLPVGAALNTVMPVVLIVLPNIDLSSRSRRLAVES